MVEVGQDRAECHVPAAAVLERTVLLERPRAATRVAPGPKRDQLVVPGCDGAAHPALSRDELSSDRRPSLGTLGSARRDASMVKWEGE